jgi:hypothetical protein
MIGWDQREPLSGTIRWAILSTKHPWNQTTIPRPQKRNFDGNYTWVMSPRWYDKRTGDYLALDTGGGSDRTVVGDRAGGSGGYRLRQVDRSQREDLPAEDGNSSPKSSSNGRFRSGATRLSATARGPISRPMRRRVLCISRRRRWPNCTRGIHAPSRLQGPGGGDRLRFP